MKTKAVRMTPYILWWFLGSVDVCPTVSPKEMEELEFIAKTLESQAVA